MKLHKWALLSAGTAFGAFSAVAALSYVYPPPRALLSRSSGGLRGASLEVIVPAYLEAGVVGTRISSLRKQLSAWEGPSSITIVASDSETAAASRSADKVLLGEPAGKPSAINQAVFDSVADVVLLTDANCELLPDTWPSVAQERMAVGWRLLSARKDERGGGESAFHFLETRAKRSPTGVRASLSVVGEFMMFRRADFRQVPPATMCDDIWMAVNFDSRALPVGVMSDVVSVEDATTGREQFERRVRIAAGLFAEQVRSPRKLLMSPLGRQFVVQKLLRITLGNMLFWASVLFTAGALLPLSLAVLPLVGLVYLGYVKADSLPRWGSLPIAAVGLQFVPPVAAVRAVRRLIGERRGEFKRGWRKVPR